MTLDEAIAELRARNEPVPNPMRLPSPEDIDEAEKALGVHFYADFRRYLLEASDVVCGALEPVTVGDPASHTDLVGTCQAAWEEAGLPRDVIPLCESNGDYYCMNQRGEVVYWSHNGWSSERWPDLAAWITDVWIAESE